MKSFTHTNYGLGFSIKRSPYSHTIEIRPGWFQRLFLRRKTKVVTLHETVSRLGATATTTIDQLAAAVLYRGGA
jgi:hypothetical protein